MDRALFCQKSMFAKAGKCYVDPGVAKGAQDAP